MKIKVTNVPVRSFAEVEIEVEEETQEAIHHAVLALRQSELRAGLDIEGVELDYAAVAGGVWNWAYEKS